MITKKVERMSSLLEEIKINNEDCYVVIFRIFSDIRKQIKRIKENKKGINNVKLDSIKKHLEADVQECEKEIRSLNEDFLLIRKYQEYLWNKEIKRKRDRNARG